jgi:hypothetical protein
MYWFASNADKAAFIADNSQTGLVLFSAFVAFSVKRVSLVDSEGETTRSATSDQSTIELTVDFTVQEKPIVGGSWEDVSGYPLDLTISVDAGDTGTYTVLTTQHFNGADDYTFNVRSSVVLGTNKVKVDCVYSDDASVSSSLIYTILLLAEQYIVFADSTVESICATNYGDGVGTTPSQAAAVTALGSHFSGNTSITSFNELSYFTGLTTIPSNAFKDCTSLQSITLPTSLTTLDGGCLRACTSLTSLEIPNLVTYIGNAALYGSTSLSIVVLRPTSVPTLGSSNVFNQLSQSLKIYVPYSSDHSVLAAYKAANYWSAKASIIYELDQNGNIPT